MPTARNSKYSKLHISPHANGWRYRRGVPADLTAVAGTKEWSRYLGQGRADAESAARELTVEHDKLIKRLRKLTAKERSDIAAVGGVANGKLADETQQLKTGLIFVNAAVAEPADGISEIDEEMSEADQKEDALYLINARTAARAMRAQLARQENALKIIGSKVQSGTVGGELLGLVDLWQRENKPRSTESIKKQRFYMQRFVTFVGDALTPRDVTSEHIRQYRDALEANPAISRANAKKHIEALQTLFGVALSKGEVTHNPVHGIKLAKLGGKLAGRDNKKLPFTSDQVRQIFAAMESMPLDFQWATRLCAYHGARANEICQIRTSDIGSEFGIPTITLHDEGEGQSIKNMVSVRRIPIHPLIRAEFLTYVAAPPRPWVFNFPQWQSSPRRGAYFIGKWSTFLRKTVGIDDSRLTLHCLRHTWINLARHMAMPAPISYAIVGHSMGNDDHTHYGTVPSIKQQMEWLSKVDPLV